MPKSSSLTVLPSATVKPPMPGNTSPFAVSQPTAVTLTTHIVAASSNVCPWSPHNLLVACYSNHLVLHFNIFTWFVYHIFCFYLTIQVTLEVQAKTFFKPVAKKSLQVLLNVNQSWLSIKINDLGKRTSYIFKNIYLIIRSTFNIIYMGFVFTLKFITFQFNLNYLNTRNQSLQTNCINL